MKPITVTFNKRLGNTAVHLLEILNAFDKSVDMKTARHVYNEVFDGNNHYATNLSFIQSLHSSKNILLKYGLIGMTDNGVSTLYFLTNKGLLYLQDRERL